MDFTIFLRVILSDVVNFLSVSRKNITVRLKNMSRRH